MQEPSEQWEASENGQSESEVQVLATIRKNEKVRKRKKMIGIEASKVERNCF
jgi:hypothetical protein